MPRPTQRPLVLLRVPRGTSAPAAERIREAIAADRKRLGLTAIDDGTFHLAGPYPIEVNGQVLDEYVAWEV